MCAAPFVGATDTIIARTTFMLNTICRGVTYSYRVDTVRRFSSSERLPRLMAPP